MLATFEAFCPECRRRFRDKPAMRFTELWFFLSQFTPEQ
jgi:hypothetical protein